MQTTSYRTLDHVERLEAARAVSVIARSLFAGHRNPVVFAESIKERPTVISHIKAAVLALNTASPIATSGEVNAFLELTNRTRLLPQLPGATQVPPSMIGVFVTDDDVVAAWLLQGQGWIPFQGAAIDNRALNPCTFGFGVAFSRELARVEDAIATRLIKRKLNSAITKAENQFLLDDEAAVPLQRPAGLLYGVSAIGGSPNEDPIVAVADLWSSVRSGSAVSPVFVTSPAGAMLLSLWGASSGERPFPNVSVTGGGNIGGVALVICDVGAVGDKLILIDTACVLWAHGGLSTQASDEASVVLDDNPTAAPHNTTSMFQTDSTAIRILRTLTWATAADDCVAFVSLPVGSPQ